MGEYDDRIFFDYTDAVETYLRMGFEYTIDKQLVLNGIEADIKRIGPGTWRASIHERIDFIRIR